MGMQVNSASSASGTAGVDDDDPGVDPPTGTNGNAEKMKVAGTVANALWSRPDTPGQAARPSGSQGGDGPCDSKAPVIGHGPTPVESPTPGTEKHSPFPRPQPASAAPPPPPAAAAAAAPPSSPSNNEGGPDWFG
jgi:hypothetical protein